ncbi:MAG: hypothetical protein Alpg2KO_19660 [Alphaproteobacteria bacterium]
MGDLGRGVFVAPEIPAFFRDVAIPQANIVTPNLFELALLTGTEVESLDRIDTVVEAAESLRSVGPDHVLITSVETPEAAQGEISMLLLCPEGRFLVSTPQLSFPIAPNGSGDATAALFLGHYLTHGRAERSLQLMSAGIYALFDATWRAGTRELQIIQAQAQVVDPTDLFRVRRL